MTERNLIRSIQRWEYEGGRMLQPEHVLYRRCFTKDFMPMRSNGAMLQLRVRETDNRGSSKSSDKFK